MASAHAEPHRNALPFLSSPLLCLPFPLSFSFSFPFFSFPFLSSSFRSLLLAVLAPLLLVLVPRLAVLAPRLLVYYIGALLLRALPVLGALLADSPTLTPDVTTCCVCHQKRNHAHRATGRTDLSLSIPHSSLSLPSRGAAVHLPSPAAYPLYGYASVIRKFRNVLR